MRKVLLVGHCNKDHPMLEEFIKENFKADVVRAKSNDEAIEILKKKNFDLVIVNRIGAFDEKKGLDLVKHMKEKIPIMLITDFDDKMKEAMEDGAVQGFGKEEVGSEKSIKLLRKYLG